MTIHPVTKDFSAWINLQPVAENKLIVVGKVETGAGNLQPQLSLVEPQGISPEVLLLKLEIVQTGELGTDDVSFRPVRYERPARKGQYSTVEIQWDGLSILTLPVTEVH